MERRSLYIIVELSKQFNNFDQQMAMTLKLSSHRLSFGFDRARMQLYQTTGRLSQSVVDTGTESGVHATQIIYHSLH